MNGHFTLSENKKTFFFEASQNPWGVAHGFPSELVLSHGERRCVKFAKTRAYVVVDENADGTPKIDTWPIRGLQVYQQ
jgi:hypothetical protein